MGAERSEHHAQNIFARYAEAFRSAWAGRNGLSSPDRTRDEIEFLPAALALQEAPVSPAPMVAMRIIVVFLLLALLWACFGRFEIVAVASGKIVPSDRVKVIQSAEPAVITAIHVRDSAVVKKGDVLIELDSTITEADRERASLDLSTSTLLAVRSEAFLDAVDSGKAPRLPDVPDVDQAAWKDALRALNEQFSEYAAKLAQIDTEIAMRDAESRSVQSVVHKLEQTVPMAQQRVDDFTRLAKNNFVSQHALAEQRQLLIEMESDMQTQLRRIEETQAAIRHARAQRAAWIAESRRATVDRLQEASQKALSFRQDVIKQEARGRLTKLASPVDGTVQQLVTHTIGGVVTPAQPLMIIVPTAESVEIEVTIENKDIGFVREGHEAQVKIESFQYTKYGTIPARLISISRDAIIDEKRGPVYAGRLKLSRADIDVEGRPIALSPGMNVTAEIKIGRRRIIEYFLSPLIQRSTESFRER